MKVYARQVWILVIIKGRAGSADNPVNWVRSSTILLCSGNANIHPFQIERYFSLVVFLVVG